MDVRDNEPQCGFHTFRKVEITAAITERHRASAAVPQCCTYGLSSVPYKIAVFTKSFEESHWMSMSATRTLSCSKSRGHGMGQHIQRVRNIWMSCPKSDHDNMQNVQPGCQ